MSIKGFIESSFLDWDGKICAVVFFAECNLRCGYCHNRDMVLGHKQLDTLDFSTILAYLHQNKDWIDGVCFSGGEPTLHENALIAKLQVVRKMGFLTKLDTNGTNPDVLERLLQAELLDYVAMDYKSMLEDAFFQEVTSPAPTVFVDDVRRSMEILRASDVDHEFRTTVFPDPEFESRLPMMANEITGAPRWFLQKMRPRHALTPRFKAYREIDDDYLNNLCAQLTPIVPNCAVRL